MLNDEYLGQIYNLGIDAASRFLIFLEKISQVRTGFKKDFLKHCKISTYTPTTFIKAALMVLQKTDQYEVCLQWLMTLDLPDALQEEVYERMDSLERVKIIQEQAMPYYTPYEDDDYDIMLEEYED